MPRQLMQPLTFNLRLDTTHLRAMKHHLSYGITVLPATGEHTLP